MIIRLPPNLPKLVWDDEITVVFGSMENLWLLTIALYAVFLLFSAVLEFFSLRFLPDLLKKRMAS